MIGRRGRERYTIEDICLLFKDSPKNVEKDDFNDAKGLFEHLNNHDGYSGGGGGGGGILSCLSASKSKC